MADYDFCRSLSPMMFQNMARDIIQIRTGLTFESFGEGPDGGVDGRVAADSDGKQVILQAKRWEKLNLSKLKKEKAKMDRVKPDRYILVLACAVSEQQKDVIFDLFSPYIRFKEDIVSGDDLNNYLGDSKGTYRSVEEKYNQLWIQNTNVLRRVLEDTVLNAILGDSERKLRTVLRNAELFVETAVYREALARLEQNHVLILSGQPGMGKSTTAEQLALYFYAQKGYTNFVAVIYPDQLSKAQRIDGKKVILFDDFWGNLLSYDPSDGYSDKALLLAIEEALRSEDCILILTTREYVLEHGLKRNESLRRLIEAHKLECRLSSYTDAEKMQIYFEHLKRSSLTRDQAQTMFHLYPQIIYSEDYNPRVLDHALSKIRPDEAPQACAGHCLELLKRPVQFWEEVFQGLTPEARLLSMLCYILPRRIEYRYAKESYAKAVTELNRTMEYQGFQQVVAELEKTVLYTDVEENVLNPGAGPVFIQFQNPSVQDFLHTYIVENLGQFQKGLSAGCICFSQLLALLKLCRECRDGGSAALQSELMARAIGALSHPDPGPEITPDTRFFSLLFLDESAPGTPMWKYFSESLHRMAAAMAKEPSTFYQDDIKQFPEVAALAVRRGLWDGPPEALMEACITCVIKNGMQLDVRAWSAEMPVVWAQYRRQHKAQIKDYLKRYYRYGLCLSAAEQDGYRFRRLLRQLREDKAHLGIHFDKPFGQEIKRYQEWLKAERSVRQAFPYESEDVTGADMEQLVSQYEEELFGSNEYLPWDTLEDEIMFTDHSEAAKRLVIQLVSEEDSWCLTDFFHSRGGLEFLLQWAEDDATFFGPLRDILRSLFQFLQKKLTHPGPQLGRLFEGLEAPKTDCFTAETFKKAAAACVNGDCRGLLEKMESLGLVAQQGLWYVFTNERLSLLALLYRISNLSEQTRRDCYGQWFGVDSAQDACVQTWECDFDFYRGLAELDRPAFREYGLKPLARAYCAEIRRNNDRETVRALLKDIDLSIDVDSNGDLNCMSYRVNRLWSAFEALEDDGVSYLFPEQFTSEEIEWMDCSGAGRQTAPELPYSVSNLPDQLLDALHITEKVVALWKKILELSR